MFEGIEFGIRKGELVTLLGPSGCGKSTLLRALAGLTPVDGGQVRVAGEDITWQAPQKRGIGMVFQSYALFPNMTVWDNVAFGLKMKPQPGRELSTSVKEALALVELDGLSAAIRASSRRPAPAGLPWPAPWWYGRGSCLAGRAALGAGCPHPPQPAPANPRDPAAP